MKSAEKTELYRQVLAQLGALLDGIEDPVASMASTVAVLHHALPYSSWTGFYRVVSPGLLRVGPYQGPIGCLEIAFGDGVCGAAAHHSETQIVVDVHAFEGHIACDNASRSEIVVPVFDSNDELMAVLDLDSHELGAFDESDRIGLESVIQVLQRHLS